MEAREPDPNITAVQQLRDRMAAEIRAKQQQLAGVDLALAVLISSQDKESIDQ